jgi:hypothetical protein
LTDIFTKLEYWTPQIKELKIQTIIRSKILQSMFV